MFFKPCSDAMTVKRGDVVVFDVGVVRDMTRRVFRAIGLPGEAVELIEGVVHIDGSPVKLEATSEEFVWEPSGARLALFAATGEGQVHLIAGDLSAPPYIETAENAGPFVVTAAT